MTYQEILEKMKNMGAIPQQALEATPEEVTIRLEACRTCNDNNIPTLTEDRKCNAMACKCCIDNIAKLKNRTCPWGRWPKL